MTTCDFEEQVLALLLDSDDVTLRNVKLFLGDQPEISKQDICQEMHAAFMLEAMGKAIISTSFADARPTVNVQEFLAAL